MSQSEPAGATGDEWGHALAELQAAHDRAEWAVAMGELRKAISNLYRYTIVDDSVVPYAQAVAAAVETFAVDLCIAVPELRFFAPESDDERSYVARYGFRDWESFGYHKRILGLCERTKDRPAEVFVRADLADEWDALTITAHEVRHAAQTDDMSDHAAEQDADDYAHRKTGRTPRLARINKERKR